MDELYNSLEIIMKEEYDRATKKFGCKHNSLHEAYAVMLEEKEEAADSLESVRLELDEFWMKTRNDRQETINVTAENIIGQALLGACEFIQVAAMAYKTLNGFANIHIWPESAVIPEREKGHEKSDPFFERGFD